MKYVKFTFLRHICIWEYDEYKQRVRPLKSFALHKKMINKDWQNLSNIAKGSPLGEAIKMKLFISKKEAFMDML